MVLIYRVNLSTWLIILCRPCYKRVEDLIDLYGISYMLLYTHIYMAQRSFCKNISSSQVVDIFRRRRQFNDKSLPSNGTGIFFDIAVADGEDGEL